MCGGDAENCESRSHLFGWDFRGFHLSFHFFYYTCSRCYFPPPCDVGRRCRCCRLANILPSVRKMCGTNKWEKFAASPSSYHGIVDETLTVKDSAQRFAPSTGSSIVTLSKTVYDSSTPQLIYLSTWFTHSQRSRKTTEICFKLHDVVLMTVNGAVLLLLWKIWMSESKFSCSPAAAKCCRAWGSFKSFSRELVCEKLCVSFEKMLWEIWAEFFILCCLRRFFKQGKNS